MLTRAARRRQALRYVEYTAEKLQLPWLCPALNTVSTFNVQTRTSSTRPSLSSSLRPATQSAPSRKLASAALVVDDYDTRDDYLPFSYEPQTPSSAAHADHLNPFDLSNILMLDQPTTRPLQRSASNRNTDLRGDVSEIEVTLEACLQVQRWDRAFKILKQLSGILAGNTRKLQQIYNRFLEAMVFDLIWNRDTQNHDRINKWIEVHMRSAGVEPTAHTFALKIKVALATLNGHRRDRTVNRYWEMAKNYQFENQVASLRDILSDNDLGKLTEICPLKIDFDLEPEHETLEPSTDLNKNVNHQARKDTQTSIRETDQKGLGLVSLRQALGLFRDPERQSLNHEQEEDLLHSQQTKLEQDAMQSALDRWKIEHEKRMKMGVSGSVQHGKIGALSWQWHQSLIQKITEELKLVEGAESSSKVTPEERLRCEYGPFLRLIKPQHLAALTTISTIQYMSKIGISHNVKLARLVTEIGRVLEAEVEAQQNKTKRSLKMAGNYNARKEMETSTAPDLHHSKVGSSLHWSVAIHAKIGALLCEMMFDVAKMTVAKEDEKTGETVTVSEPIFQHKVVYVHGRRVASVALNPAFRDLLMREPPADLIAKQLPMISKPKPWTGFADGGYLQSTIPVLRVKFDDVSQGDYAKAAAERGDLDQLFTGLDVLGSTGWKINKDVFSVMLEAWNSGEKVANLPPVDKVFPTVDKPSEEATPTEKWKYYSKMRAIENERSGIHSNRCFQNFQMEIARSYLDQTFYLPHNVDFRGRAYPIPPYLNQMGADNARGLLLFANGRALGKDGLRWLQIHLANVFGYDKASLSDRAQFAVNHIDDIRDSVKDALGSGRWWLKAEDPWQCLATCHELVRALDSPDPAEYVSHLPVHQDGTCNGLQHYAALGGDIAGARQVNLEPGDKPADVYTGVAELVKSEIKQDAEEGLEIAQLLDGRLTRKIVKQTVMTNVYGVTFTGAIRQVRKQVDDLLPDLNANGKASQAATYIARKIFKGLGTLFEGAHEIQYWLGDCANRITHSISPAQLRQFEKNELKESQLAKIDASITRQRKKKQPQSAHEIDAGDFRSTVIWTTPLKLPVVQPYRTSRSEVVQTSIAGLKLIQPTTADAVDPRKQLQGFPPNFVHSLDATHMMLSALKAQEMNLTFSAVHDSFWTHAADIHSLNTLLREAFIRMHSENIIGRLAAEFRTRYKGHWYLAKIGGNNILAKKVLQYRTKLPDYKSDEKQQRYNELVREIKRMRLMASDKPADRAEGEKMVTAASLFQKYGGDRYLPSKVSLGQTAIGEMPEADPLAVEDALNANGASADVDLESTLEPLIDEANSMASGRVNRERSNSGSGSSKKRSKASTNKHVWLWLPLTFKQVPKKGDFKIENLRDSTYFFS